MYLRRYEEDLRAFRMVVLFWKVERGADLFHPRRLGCSNVTVAVSLCAPPDASVSVAMEG